MEHKAAYWTTCNKCKGLGSLKQRVRKKSRLRYELDLKEFEQSNRQGSPPSLPKEYFKPCTNCNGSGLITTDKNPLPHQKDYPHVAIVGGGIGGVALAVACLHRQIPFTLYESDLSFNARSQGYGLTLQQASPIIKAFGIISLQQGVVSTKHIVHTTKGNIIGEWGMRKWLETETVKSNKRSNIHIARQSLRAALLGQLGGNNSVEWGHKFIDFKQGNDGRIALNFKLNGKSKSAKADLLVGADGIYSSVRKKLKIENNSPLNYLGCIVILGICPLKNLNIKNHPLLDSATVFQTVNGKERIYMMPYDTEAIMWQFSFPLAEKEAKNLSHQGANALKKETLRRAQWHNPIPEIIRATEDHLVSGYPVYDREILTTEALKCENQATLIGDAAHPMSPFKGQGANQALLDAITLARSIAKVRRPLSQWRETGIRKAVLNKFEKEMIERTAVKVKESAAAAKFLHTEEVLLERNEPRGRYFKGN